MINLETAIAEWRGQLRLGGIESPALLDELENHLREDIATLTGAGRPAAEAFKMAVARVGSPGNVVAEFDKTKPRSSLPVFIALLAWFGAAVSCLGILLARWAEGKLSLLLAAHVFSLTAGYATAFWAGIFGIYAIFRQRRGIGLADGPITLVPAIRWSTLVSAGLVVVGFILGMIWSRQNRGYWLGSDPRAIGTLGAAAWLVAASIVLRFKSKHAALVKPRLPAQLGIIGNIIIGLAWFGAGSMAHGYAAGSYLPLNVFLGVHLFFLGMTVMPGHEAGRKVVET